MITQNEILDSIEERARQRYGDRWIAGLTNAIADHEGQKPGPARSDRLVKLRPGLERIFKNRSCSLNRLILLLVVLDCSLEFCDNSKAVIAITEKQETILFLQSFRYALGRRSYAVAHTADLVTEFWPQLSRRTQRLIKRELLEAFDRDDISRSQGETHHPLGMDIDRDIWEELRERLD